MADKLIVTLITDSSTPLFEHKITKDVITIGRAQGNDVVLTEAKRGVSGSHAKLAKHGNSYFLVDLDSKNGTFFKEKKIEPGQLVEIKNGSHFSIEGFRLQLLAEDDELERTLERFDAAEEAESLSEDLKILHAKHAMDSPALRKEALREALLHRISKLSPFAARTVCVQVKSRFASGESSTEPASSDALQKIEEQESLYRAGYKVLGAISNRLLGMARFETAEEVERFGRLIEGALGVTVRWLSKSLQGRQEFETQFSADLTLLMGRDANPIKQISADEKEIAVFLLNWKDPKDPAATESALEGAFKDLTMHQLGLLSGVQGCLKAVLERLDPQVLEKRSRELAKGWMQRLFCKFLVEIPAWRQYVLSHKEMFQENSKLFNELIYPSIRQGYLVSHAGAAPRRATTRPAGEEESR